MDRSFLLLHGLFNHRPPEHWQHWLAGELRATGEQVVYPQLPDPDAPSFDAWRGALHDALAALDGGEQIVACHSLSCLLWLRTAAERPSDAPPLVDRLLLVAPPSAAQVPPEGADFLLSPRDGDAVRRSVAGTIRVVHSDDDPYDPDGAGAAIAAAAGAQADLLLRAGHVNPDSGYGPWPSVLAWCRDPATRLHANR
jgi:predicted alpha/beta hydrolase family esterase